MIIIILISLAGVFLKLKSEINRMTPIGTGHLTGQIYAILDEMVNVYLIHAGNGYIVIDAGNDIQAVKQGLKELNIESQSIIAVFLTHSDPDHVASLPLFEKASIYLSQQEEQMINGQTKRFIFQHNKIDAEDYLIFKDGQVFDFSDISVKCILTPGHTPGASSFLINNQYLFTGDALSLHNGEVHEFIKLATIDKITHRKSIHKISALPNISHMFTAHHGMTADFIAAFQNWIE
jgi:glyoxylase-like metal-dependent hydrolase (beta-lactamase superfamily II)